MKLKKYLIYFAYSKFNTIQLITTCIFVNGPLIYLLILNKRRDVIYIFLTTLITAYSGILIYLYKTINYSNYSLVKGNTYVFSFFFIPIILIIISKIYVRIKKY